MMKTYYQCRLTQLSPLSITNGEGDTTDLDLLLDRRGMPFLPGSTVAGLLRSMLSIENQNALFGYITKNAGSNTEISLESKLIVSDATLPDGAEIHISERDGVGINARGTAENGAKYDFQVVETDVPYTAVLELTHENEQDQLRRTTDDLMNILITGGLRAGHRTTRGYGRFEAEVFRKTFDFSKQEDAEAWLDFDPFANGVFDDAEPLVKGENGSERKEKQYEASFTVDGNFTVRVYSSDVGEADMKPLMGRCKNALVPVIPGAGWAGAFRHRMKELVQQFPDAFPVTEEEIDAFFGNAGGDDRKKSQIRFSETQISGGQPLNVARIALDRFTMSPKQAALFEESVWCGGNGVLKLSIPYHTDQAIVSLIDCCLLDFHYGLVSFGGEAGIGRGRMIITELRINNVKQEQLLGHLLKGDAE